MAARAVKVEKARGKISTDALKKTVFTKVIPEGYVKHVRGNCRKMETYFEFEREYFNEEADRANASANIGKNR